MCLCGKDFYGVAAVCKEATESGLDSKRSDKLCHMPDLVVKCSIFSQAELKDKEEGFHVGRCSCEETGMMGQKVGWRRITQEVSEDAENCCFSQRLITRGHSKSSQQPCQGWVYSPQMKNKHPGLLRFERPISIYCV